MLEYENQMFLDILHEDGLVIVAKGLGVDRVFTNLIKVYSDPGNLVIVLGSDAREEQHIIEELSNQGVTPLPKILTADISIAEREKLYLEGGVLFVSSRIIVVDLLKNRVPAKHITGFLVQRAHRIIESCQDGFALRLYRLQNNTGFVKAFSTSAESFTRGFARIERVMRTLFVKNLYLWPRFHAVVNDSLEKRKPEVVELHLKLTPAMLEIQTALLDLINYVVKEIKRANPLLDTDDVTVENALTKSFQKLLQLQLDPVWHQLSPTSRQLVSDLKLLRHLLISLTQTDSVRFYNYVQSLRSTDYAQKSSGWVLLDSAETLFVRTKERLYDSKKNVSPECDPKWKVLSEILREIKESSPQPETVLILAETIVTCRQLKEYLMKGSEKMLQDIYNRYGVRAQGDSQSSHTISDDVTEDENDCFTLTQTLDSTFVECSGGGATQGSEPVVVLEPFKKDGDPNSLSKMLENIKPHFVIMYDANIMAVRQLEVYQANNACFKLTVYFLIYSGAVEEQAYLTTLRREKNAFDFLIKEKMTMAVPAEQDGKSGDCPELQRDLGKVVGEVGVSVNTRKGGVQTASVGNPLVIVDMREFRSELPVLLHRRGIDIEPVTLQIGDYILTPEMCVERKSISDLISSLNSGRLYQQAVSMSRHYAKPMLLIEFDQDKPFDLQGRLYLSKNMSSSDITSKLQLLTLHFPKLRIVWSPSPYATAQLFQELKEGREEPVLSSAILVGQGEEKYDTDKYNVVIKDFVSKLPGISTLNLMSVLNGAESLVELLSFSKERLNEILRNSNDAQLLYNALHSEQKSNQTSVAPAKSTAKSKGFRVLKKKKAS